MLRLHVKRHRLARVVICCLAAFTSGSISAFDGSSEALKSRRLDAATYNLSFYSDSSCSAALRELRVGSDFCQRGNLNCTGPYLMLDHGDTTQKHIFMRYLFKESVSCPFELDIYLNARCEGDPVSQYTIGSMHESKEFFNFGCARSYEYPSFKPVHLKWEEIPPDCAAQYGPLVSTTTTTTTTTTEKAHFGACSYEESFLHPFVMVAGRFGSHGSSELTPGDDSPAIGAQLNYPLDIVLDPGKPGPPPAPAGTDEARFPPRGAVVMPPGAQVTPIGRQVLSYGATILPPTADVMPMRLEDKPDRAVVLPPGAKADPLPRVLVYGDVMAPGPEVQTYGAVVVPPGPPGVSYGSVVMPPGTRVTPPGAEVVSWGAAIKPEGPAMPKWAHVFPQEVAVKPPAGMRSFDQPARPTAQLNLPGSHPLPLAEVIPAGVPVRLPRPHRPRVKPRGARQVYVSDSSNHAVRVIDVPTGTISTIAGNLAQPGSHGDGKRASSAGLRRPHGLALDVSRHRLYVADYGNHVVRYVDLATEVIRSVVGTLEVPGHGGDGGPALSAQLRFPVGLALDSSAEMLYVADSGNHAIRQIDMSDGVISTIAGTLGSYGKSGDGGPAIAASLNTPRSISLDTASSKLYIADYGNHAVRAVDLTLGTISTVAGVLGITGGPGDGALDGKGTLSHLCYPTGLALDQAGQKLYIADSCNMALRRLDLITDMLVTVAARPGFLGHLGDAGPIGLAFDPLAQQIYTAEARNHVVRVTDADKEVDHHNPTCRVVKVM